jgi:hypothetical protein
MENKKPILIDGIELFLNKKTIKYKPNETQSINKSTNENNSQSEQKYQIIPLPININKFQYEHNKSWSKLTNSNKHKLINNYIDKIAHTIAKKNELRFLLMYSIAKKHINKSTDVVYNKDTCELEHIYKLYYCNDSYYINNYNIPYCININSYYINYL